MPQNDDDVFAKIKEINDKTTKVQEDLLKQVNDLKKSMNDQTETLKIMNETYKLAMRRAYDEMKVMQNMDRNMVMLAQRLQGGVPSEVRFRLGAKGKGVQLMLRPEEREALKGTFFGRILERMTTRFKKLVLLFPSLGFKGFKEMSRVSRSTEFLAMHLKKSGGMIEGFKKGGIGGALKGMPTTMLGIFITAQGIFAIIKVLGMLFGDAVKPLMGIFKIFKMAVTFLIKPIFDVLSILLLPIAIFFLILFSKFYKWFVSVAFRRLVKWIIGIIKSVKGFADAVSGFFGAVGNVLGIIFDVLYTIWSGGFKMIINGIMWIVNAVKIVAGFVKPIIDWVVKLYVHGILIAIKVFKLIGGVITKIIKSVVGFFAGLIKFWFGIITKVINTIWVVLKTIWNVLVNTIGFVLKTIWNVLNSIWNGIMSIVKFFINLPSEIGKAISNVLHLPSFQTGGYVQKSGLYRLHAGETVVPRWGEKATTNNTTNNISITVHANEGMSVDELVDEIERRIRSVVSW